MMDATERKKTKEINRRLSSYRSHHIFVIETWEENRFKVSYRTYYIYDRELKKSFYKDYLGTVELRDQKEEIEKLEELIHNRSRLSRNGIFSRKVKIDGFSKLFYLVSIMDGKEVLGRGVCMDEKFYRQKENDYVKNLFDYIIATK
jgi:hypothetical protein